MEVLPPETPAVITKPKIFAGIGKNKRYVIVASFLVLLFWFIQFVYQYEFLSVNTQSSLIRSFALTGATLISIALMIGPIARFWPRRNYIIHRRTLGVWGFTFIIMHAFTVIYYIFNFDISAIFFDLNPYVNPVIFGIIAFLLFLPLYLTSTDWAVMKLGFKKWKAVHRLIYFGYIFAILHFLLVNPPFLQNYARGLLLVVTVAALILQVAGFVKTISKSKNKKAALAGIIIIAVGAMLLYWAFF